MRLVLLVQREVSIESGVLEYNVPMLASGIVQTQLL